MAAKLHNKRVQAHRVGGSCSFCGKRGMLLIRIYTVKDIYDLLYLYFINLWWYNIGRSGEKINAFPHYKKNMGIKRGIK